jgi:hypothetical protein
MRWFVVAIVVALRLVALHAPAHADPSEDAALAHLDRGIAAFNAKDFRRALTELTAAHQLAPDKANPYRWLALTEIQLNDCVSALVHIEQFLARVPAADERVAEMKRWRDFCRRPPARSSPQPSPQVTGTQGLAAPAPPPRKPLRERWWFWPAIGTAAVVLTGAVVYAATDADAPVLPTIRCDNTGCR